MSAAPPLDSILLSRIEDAGINASAPREQRWIDGWLVRTAPGKAKRARCVQPVAAGVGSLDARLAWCGEAYRSAGLPLHVRITPFARPEGLDAHLDGRGMARIGETLVMAMDGEAADVEHSATAIEPIDGAAYAAWIGAARRSTPDEIASHVDRIAGAPVLYRAFVIRGVDGSIEAGGQVVVENDLAGLYDVWTLRERRCRGLGESLCRGLMAQARRDGARTLYLQVEADNAAALRLYRRLGFAEAYRYHYRTPAAKPADG